MNLLDINGPLSSFVLPVHIDMGTSWLSDGVDVTSSSPNHSADGRGWDAHFLGPEGHKGIQPIYIMCVGKFWLQNLANFQCPDPP